MMENSNIIVDKSMAFAIRIVNLYKYLKYDKKEHILSQQILRSGTSIGANIKEAIQAQSKADFRAKMYIALKEASETEYWLTLLKETNFITSKQGESMLSDCLELLKILTAITKSSKDDSKK